MSNSDWLRDGTLGGEKATFKEERKKESRTGMAKKVRRGIAESPIRPFLDCWGLFCTVQLFYRQFCALFYLFCLFSCFFFHSRACWIKFLSSPHLMLRFLEEIKKGLVFVHVCCS